MGVSHNTINISTKGENDIVDITNKIQDCIKKSSLKHGICCVFVPGSTGTITTVEYEPGLQKDIPEALDKIAPRNQYYAHHETWHDDNGRSHVKASLMGPSITIPFQDKKLIHGTWQQIVFMELDTRARNRILIVQLLGE
jgi:secondary thiamine-phosphate synthase enzyme